MRARVFHLSSLVTILTAVTACEGNTPFFPPVIDVPIAVMAVDARIAVEEFVTIGLPSDSSGRLALDAAGNLYVGVERPSSAGGGAEIMRVTSSGIVFPFATLVPSSIPDCAVVFNSWATDLAVDASGNLFVALAHGLCIVKLDATGGIVATNGPHPVRPVGLGLASTGSAAVAFWPSGRIITYTSDLSGSFLAQLPAGQHSPAGLAFEPGGDLAVLDFSGSPVDGFTATMYRVAPSGNLTAGASYTPAIAASGLPDIALDNDGVFCPAGDYLVPNGTQLLCFNFTSGFGNQVGTGFLQVSGLAMSSSGELFVSDIGQDRIFRLSHRGAPPPPAQTFRLRFPLPGRNPQTVSTSAIFDHSMTQQYCPDGVVVAYTREEARNEFGTSDWSVSFGSCDFQPLHGFKNAKGAEFRINNNYTGGCSSTDPCSDFLFYDGHPGYDFSTTDQDPLHGEIDVLAAADGTVDCVDDLSCSMSRFGKQGPGEIRINHTNGYFTVYLHLSSFALEPGDPVVAGQPIGVSGDVGVPGAPHLHFEVRRLIDGILVPVDPYGWLGNPGTDPYQRARNVRLW
jgi:murein DD-endopeptidase MepM/ murein hydrolase activator NlpD